MVIEVTGSSEAKARISDARPAFTTKVPTWRLEVRFSHCSLPPWRRWIL